MFNLKFLVILFLGFVDYLGIGLVCPIFTFLLFDPETPFLAADASSSFRGAVLGVLVGLTPLTAFVTAPMLGSFSDVYGRKKAILFGASSGFLGYFLAVIALFYHSIGLLFVYRILVGITEASAAVAQAAIADISDESQKARRFSLFSSSAGLGFTIGPFVGGMLADIEGLGYFFPFLIAGLFCLVNMALVWKLFPECKELKDKVSFKLFESLINLKKVLEWKHLTFLFAANFCLSFAWAFFNEFMPVLLQAQFAFDLSEIGKYFAWGGFFYSLSSGLLTAPLLSRYPIEKLVMTALAGCSICMALFSFINQAMWVWTLVPFLMFFLALAFPTLSSLVSNSTDNRSQGEVLGVFYSVQGFAMGISPLFVGSLIGAYPALTGFGSSFMMLIAFLICFYQQQKRKEALA